MTAARHTGRDWKVTITTANGHPLLVSWHNRRQRALDAARRFTGTRTAELVDPVRGITSQHLAGSTDGFDVRFSAVHVSEHHWAVVATTRQGHELCSHRDLVRRNRAVDIVTRLATLPVDLVIVE